MTAEGVASPLVDETRGFLLHVILLHPIGAIRCYVEVSTTTSVKELLFALLDLKISELISGDVSAFQLAECTKNRICALFSHAMPVVSIKPYACLYVFELACGSNQLGGEVGGALGGDRSTEVLDAIEPAVVEELISQSETRIEPSPLSLPPHVAEFSASDVSTASTVRVLFTHRRIKLVSVYSGIEKYATEAFGTPIMLVSRYSYVYHKIY